MVWRLSLSVAALRPHETHPNGWMRGVLCPVDIILGALKLTRYPARVWSSSGRVLSIDDGVADRWGHVCAIRPVPVIDGLLAATAATHDPAVVTRHTRYIPGLSVAVHPFRPGEPPLQLTPPAPE